MTADGSPSATDLHRLQRWMLSVVTHPSGVEAGIEDEATRRITDVTTDRIEEVVGRSKALDSVSRLQVYANAYFVRLLECLREEFVALHTILGQETFDAFAFQYLQADPPHSYTLGELGANFPRFLRENQPAEDLAADVPTWSHLLIDLARLERLYSEIFDGPGTENGTPLRPDDLQSIPTEAWPGCRLKPVPCLRLETFDFPVHVYRTAVTRGEEPTPPSPELTHLVLTRREFVVRRTALPVDEFEMLGALVDGATVGEAVGRWASQSELPDHELAPRIRTMFAGWAAANYFASVELP